MIIEIPISFFYHLDSSNVNADVMRTSIIKLDEKYAENKVISHESRRG